MKGAVYVFAAIAAALAVLALLYLIGRAVHRARDRARAAADRRARDHARWEPYSDPQFAAIEVGIDLVAHVSTGRVVLDRVAQTTVHAGDPDWELDVALQNARVRADQLNAVREEAHRG